eukprot:TRINITY_DN8964_c0_g1_i3.p1 TRINITY_DN8964_c0_g1~~TRINITY_DN8964_c0_g1_i3.p1  ORF type:complete len:116 (-),score=14.93 TRINITY_DN8964_c0_g1_i3:10-357(-)
MPLDYEYQFTRPWLDLYYVRIPAPPPLEYTDSVIVSLPDDVLLQVFRHLDVVSLVRMMSVCRRWSNICAANLLWRPFCLLVSADSKKYIDITLDYSSSNISSVLITSSKGSMKEI